MKHETFKEFNLLHFVTAVWNKVWLIDNYPLQKIIRCTARIFRITGKNTNPAVDSLWKPENASKK